MPSLFLSLSSNLPEFLYLYGQRYNTLRLLRALEQGNRIKILDRENRIRRNMINTTIEIKIIQPLRPGVPLVVPTRDNGTIEIYPTW